MLAPLRADVTEPRPFQLLALQFDIQQAEPPSWRLHTETYDEHVRAVDQHYFAAWNVAIIEHPAPLGWIIVRRYCLPNRCGHTTSFEWSLDYTAAVLAADRLPPRHPYERLVFEHTHLCPACHAATESSPDALALGAWEGEGGAVAA